MLMMARLTPERIAKAVADRLQSKHLTVFGKDLFLDAQGTVRMPNGKPVWEFEEQDYSTWGAEEISRELEKVFWHDREELTA